MAFKEETTKKKIVFIQKNQKLATFVALLTSYIINPFSASHLIKLFISFSISVEIMKCTFIGQNNNYCLILKR